MLKEIWKNIKNFSNYEVSNLGNVRNKKTKKILKYFTGDKYYRVKLRKDNKTYTVKIHRLVAESFLPNPNKLPQVNHIDEDTHNNKLGNLEWCSFQYNIDYSISKKVLQYDLSGNFIKEYKSASDAARQLGISVSSISDNCLGKTKTCKGFVFIYK